jgi:hypothetical protein
MGSAWLFFMVFTCNQHYNWQNRRTTTDQQQVMQGRLGGLGLILPTLTRIGTRLVPAAGFGLTLVMIGAVVYHVPRGEVLNILMNIVLAAIVAFIAYGRWRKHPIPDRSAS